jgi:Glycosyltransferase family 87
MAGTADGPAGGRGGSLGRLAALAGAAAVVPLAGWAFWALVLRLGPNDFHDYWLAGRLILQGRSPYDVEAMRALAAQEHLSFLVGGGYSYPLPFAVAMVPFGALPFDVAVVSFNLISVAAFAATVAVWLEWAHGRTVTGAATTGRLPGRLLGAAFVAGAYPPVYGTVAMGQANLVLLPLMAAGLALASAGGRARGLVGGGLVGLAAVVKLVPAVVVIPLALGRRVAAAAGVVAGALGAFALSVAAAPWAAAGSGGLTSLLDPDPFYTNQSINGFVTRLVESSQRTLPLWNAGFDPRPVSVAVTAGFGLATLGVLWLARRQLTSRRGLALGMGFALAAGVAGAPKTSFWNESMALAAVALLMLVEAPSLRLGRLGRLDLGLLAAWFCSALIWALVWAVEPPRAGPLAAGLNLVWSSSLYGMACLWLLFARRLLGAATYPATIS